MVALCKSNYLENRMDPLADLLLSSASGSVAFECLTPRDYRLTLDRGGGLARRAVSDAHDL